MNSKNDRDTSNAISISAPATDETVGIICKFAGSHFEIIEPDIPRQEDE